MKRNNVVANFKLLLDFMKRSLCQNIAQLQIFCACCHWSQRCSERYMCD